MTQVLERPLAVTDSEQHTDVLISGQPPVPREQLLGSGGLRGTGIVEIPTVSAVSGDQTNALPVLLPLSPKAQHSPDSEHLTQMIASSKKRIHLPPAVLDPTSMHNLQAEAEEAMAKKDSLLPPFISAEDGFTATRAIVGARLMIKDKYGEQAYEDILKKTAAITDVAIANAKPTYSEFSQYARLRQGLPQDTTIPTLDPRKSDLDAFYEPPMNQVPAEPLIYDETQSDIVLAALRYSYAYPMKSATHGPGMFVEREGDSLSYADVLSRYSPLHLDRAFYGAIVEQAAANPRIGNVPHYDTVS